VTDESGPRRDIRDEDLHETLTAFYAIIAVDPLLLRYFEKVDMSLHMPRIVAFWSTLLFHTRSYSGNAFRPHLEMPGLSGEHFAFWVGTLERIVDARFTGPSASLMKELAHRIAYSMQLRLGIPPFEPFRASA
jgi:hemoglobin